MEIEILTKGYRCERCNHEWMPRIKERTPMICPNCSSCYWNIPRKRKKLFGNKNPRRKK